MLETAGNAENWQHKSLLRSYFWPWNDCTFPKVISSRFLLYLSCSVVPKQFGTERNHPTTSGKRVEFRVLHHLDHVYNVHHRASGDIHHGFIGVSPPRLALGALPIASHGPVAMPTEVRFNVASSHLVSNELWSVKGVIPQRWRVRPCDHHRWSQPMALQQVTTEKHQAIVATSLRLFWNKKQEW